MKIYVTGYEGRLGSELVNVLGCSPLQCDIRSGKSVIEAISTSKPDVVINCAAKTGVDECELEEGFEEALKVNFRGAMTLRNNFRGHLIHLSTDYVFDCNTGPYSEDQDNFFPVNRYGWTKYGAEAALGSVFSEGRTTIVRTTGLYGSKSDKEDLAKSMVNTLRKGEEFYATDELFGNQTYIPHLAEALIKLAYSPEYKLRDIVHIGSSEVVSRYYFAVFLAEVFGLDKGLIHPCKNSDIKSWRAVRPTNGGLVTTLAESYMLPIYSIKQGLEGFLNRMS